MFKAIFTTIFYVLLQLQPFMVPRTTRVSRYQKGKTNLDLLEREIVSGSGISWALYKSAPRPRQIAMPAPTAQFFTGRMPFLPPNQQHQITADTQYSMKNAANLQLHAFNAVVKNLPSTLAVFFFLCINTVTYIFIHI